MAITEAGISVDATDFIEKVKRLNDLTHKELLRVFNRSLSRATIQTVVKEARRDLRKHLAFSDDSTGKTAKALGVKSAKRSPLVLAGARVQGERYAGQLIHILDSGTDSRSTRSGANRGRVLGLDFYSQALRSSEGELSAKFDIYLQENFLKRIESKVK